MKNQRKNAPIRRGEKPRLNRGIELILRRRETTPIKANILLLQFGKMVRFFKREITIYFELSLDVRKPRVER